MLGDAGRRDYSFYKSRRVAKFKMVVENRLIAYDFTFSTPLFPYHLPYKGYESTRAQNEDSGQDSGDSVWIDGIRAD